MVEKKRISGDKLRIMELETINFSYQKEIVKLRDENKQLKEQIKGEKND